MTASQCSRWLSDLWLIGRVGIGARPGVVAIADTALRCWH